MCGWQRTSISPHHGSFHRSEEEEEARSENFVSQIWEKVTASVESKIEIDGSDIKYWLVAARSAMTDRMFLQGRLRVNGRSVGEVVILEGKQV